MFGNRGDWHWGCVTADSVSAQNVEKHFDTHTHTQALSVLNPFQQTEPQILKDTDLAGPIIIGLLFGIILLVVRGGRGRGGGGEGRGGERGGGEGERNISKIREQCLVICTHGFSCQFHG